MMLKCNNVTITLKNAKVIVKNLNFILNTGDRLALIGEEGNGKSTLLKYLLNPRLIDNYCNYKGNIVFQGKIGYLRQNINEYEKYSVLEFLSIIDEDRVDYEIYNKGYLIKKLFNEFNLDVDILNEDRKLGCLSGGEKVKLQLIKLRLCQADILLLDEPSNDLDLATLEFLQEYLLDFDGIVIFASHDNFLLSKVANKILHFEQNKDNGEVSCIFVALGYQEYLEERRIRISKQNAKAYLENKELKKKSEILRKFKQKVENDMAKAVRDPTTGRLLAKKMKNIKSQ